MTVRRGSRCEGCKAWRSSSEHTHYHTHTLQARLLLGAPGLPGLQEDLQVNSWGYRAPLPLNRRTSSCARGGVDLPPCRFYGVQEYLEFTSGTAKV